MRVFAQGVKLPDYPSDFAFKDKTIGAILSELFGYLLPLAGLLSLAMIIWGGFLLMFSSGEPEAVKTGTSKIIYGVVGFAVVFAAYWLGKIVEVIFGIPVW